MTAPRVLDTVTPFVRAWKEDAPVGVRAQISAWERFYRARWPDLVELQQRSYRSAGVSWRAVAERRVFPSIQRNWRGILAAHASLPVSLRAAEPGLRAELGYSEPVLHVMHVGLGCGAGWATTFRGRTAVLYGLENLAELGWTRPARLSAHIRHEMAHLAHSALRRDAGEAGVDRLGGPYGRLYVEGFATVCETPGGVEGHPLAVDRDPGWSRWCRSHRRALARRFLRTVRARRSVRAFFGSWYAVEGHIEVGYWLGAAIVRRWRATDSLRAIATLPAHRMRERVAEGLRALSEETTPG